MLAISKRLSSRTWRIVRLSSLGSRQGFKDTSSERGWKNETPAGSSTEVFVYNPEFDIKWPNQQLGVLASKDKNFALPGDIGSLPDGRLGSLQVAPPASHPDILTRPTQREAQVHTLYNANDYIKYTMGSEKDIFSEPKMLRDFPDLPSVEMMDLEAHDAPALVRRELSLLFPEEDLSSGTLSVVTLSFYTENDMSKWSEEMEEEREKLMEHSVVICKELCGRFKEEGYWADFIDPASGTPHYSPHTNSTLFETNETYRALGFEIDDLGCCKVISHLKFGHNVFVTTIVTNCSVENDVMESLETEFSSLGSNRTR